MFGIIAVYLITLGVGQLAATGRGLRGASLVGPGRTAGYVTAGALLLSGAMLLPDSFFVLLWMPLAGPLAVITLLVGGSFILPPPNPTILFEPDHPAHGSCYRVQIPNGDDLIPGVILGPPKGVERRGAVCVIHGSGDTKTSYKWRLLKALLARGVTVLTIDMPGHGDYKHKLLSYPEVTSIVPSALRFLRQQPGVQRVGLVGISLGGAVAIAALAGQKTSSLCFADALVVFETPICLNYNRRLFYREVWNTLYGAPLLSLLGETSIKQLRETWLQGGYRGRHSTGDLFNWLNPVKNIRQLHELPILLVYSRRDLIAPPGHARAMREAAPHAAFLEAKKASHVALTLMPEINHQVAAWVVEQLG